MRVSANGRHLVHDDGRPFFYLADTAWELFHRLDRADSELFLRNRAAHRFTVIQAVALAELDGIRTPNANGDLPLLADDPTRPNEPYWAHVDRVIAQAAALGLVVGLLPTWGDKAVPMWGSGPVIFTPPNAYSYGRFLGARYRQQPIIWILGGDRPAVGDGFDTRPIWHAMADGIRAGVAGPALMTYHPLGGASSSAWLHDELWLDFNMQQSGHGAGRDVAVWDLIAADYERVPPKPVLDGEINYEDHPVSPWPRWNPKNGYFRAYDVRKQAYRSVFAGACGVTYGHHAVWQMYAPPHELINHADRTWREALDRPGAQQMRHLRALIEGRPMLTRVPDQALLRAPAGRGSDVVAATRAEDGAYALIYSSSGQPFEVDVTRLSGTTLDAWWFDPRTGAAFSAGQYRRERDLAFTPPAQGDDNDWVLVLDDAAQGFGPPGQEQS